MEVKSTMRLDGLTLNERLSEMFDNPTSEFQKSIRWKKTIDGRFVYDGINIDGKNPDAQRVLEIIRQYEQAKAQDGHAQPPAFAWFHPPRPAPSVPPPPPPS